MAWPVSGEVSRTQPLYESSAHIAHLSSCHRTAPFVLSHMPSAMQPDGVCSSPTTSDNLNRRNILIVGDVGVGKSSLINLISGRELAKTSNGAKSCTLRWEEYIVTLDGVEFGLHDTAGLHEAKGGMNRKEYLDSVSQAYSLISTLERSGGISLIVFCMRFGRVTSTMQDTYNLFVEVFCNRQVPVVIVVTYLDSQHPMEQWWKDNEKDIKYYGLRSLGHACITTTRGPTKAWSDNYDESRAIVKGLLLKHSDRVAWKEEKAGWFKRVVLFLWGWLSPRVKQRDRSDLRTKLNKRCGLSVEDADLVAQKIEQSREVSGDAPEGDNKSWFDEKFGTDSSVSLSAASKSYI